MTASQNWEDVYKAQTARIAELEKDAARYRWLREKNIGMQLETIVATDLDTNEVLFEVKLDTAIDNAMKGET